MSPDMVPRCTIPVYQCPPQSKSSLEMESQSADAEPPPPPKPELRYPGLARGQLSLAASEGLYCFPTPPPCECQCRQASQ